MPVSLDKKQARKGGPSRLVGISNTHDGVVRLVVGQILGNNAVTDRVQNQLWDATQVQFLHQICAVGFHRVYAEV